MTRHLQAWAFISDEGKFMYTQKPVCRYSQCLICKNQNLESTCTPFSRWMVSNLWCVSVMEYYLLIKRNKQLGWISRKLCCVKRVHFKRLHFVLFHLYHILEDNILEMKSILVVRIKGQSQVGWPWWYGHGDSHGSATWEILVVLELFHILTVVADTGTYKVTKLYRT